MIISFPRILRAPTQSFFLFGVRGIGKSTWVRHSLPRARSVDLLSEAAFQDYLVNPSQFYDEHVGLREGTWVVLDEVQRLPNLLNEVHRLIEKRRLRFALLGSSARKLRRAGVNLLGGRALSFAMYPLSPLELGEHFNLDRALSHGGIPLVVTARSPQEQLQAYVQTYLKQEIQAEAIVRNLPGFARFLPVAAMFHAQILNMDSLARDAGVARTTVHGYLDILEDTLLAFRLPAFEGRLRVKERRHPKLYWVDPGLVRSAKKQLGKLTIEERGPLFEGYVVQLLRTYQSVGLLEYDDLYYWASGSGALTEVDLLVQRGRELTAVEIKAGGRVRDDWFRGFRAVSEMEGVKKKILVYTGERSYTTADKVHVVPFREFETRIARGEL